MARSKFRRAPRFENLESRQLLSTGVSSQGPTNDAQYMLQLLNEARTDPSRPPQQFIQSNITPDIRRRSTTTGSISSATLQAIASATPQPPLAWNAQLAQAAQAHSQDMATNQFQSHTGSDGSSPPQRIQQAGYTNATIDRRERLCLRDLGRPRRWRRSCSTGASRMTAIATNIQQPGVSAQNAYRDVGIGLVNTGAGSSVGPLVVTQDFARRPTSRPRSWASPINDTQGTGFYAVGRGRRQCPDHRGQPRTGQVSSTQTWASGGYELALNPGQYQLIASVNNQVIASRTIYDQQRERRAGLHPVECPGGRIAPERDRRRPAPARARPRR